MAAQMFIYLLGIIVAGLILLLGFKAVQKLEENKCTVQETQFSTALASAMDKDKGWGISRTETFTLPCNAEAVCFVSRQSTNNNELYADSAVLTTYELQYGTIVESVHSGDDVNVFLKTSDGFERLERFEVAAPIDLPMDEPIRCFSGAPLKIKFQGKGQTVEVKDAGSN
jgi:hypothetical protein